MKNCDESVYACKKEYIKKDFSENLHKMSKEKFEEEFFKTFNLLLQKWKRDETVYITLPQIVKTTFYKI
jgi:hypothetical protein